MVESFVLQGLDVIPRTAGIAADLIVGEHDFRYLFRICGRVLTNYRDAKETCVDPCVFPSRTT